MRYAFCLDWNMKPLLLATLLVLTTSLSAQISPGLRMKGRSLVTPCGDTVILRGVNKMVVWTNDLDLRKATYAEIKKTGANCVRIVWLAQPGQFEVDAGPEGLDRNIQDAIDAGLLPMVELHDATGDWSKLSMVVDYWTRPDVVAIVQKHERYLLVNIANECGNENITDVEFIRGYTTAIGRMRTAGIRTPLIIDAADWGKNLEQLVRTAPTLTAADVMHNILYSVHMYWAISDGADGQYIGQQFANAVNAGLPFIVGEFTSLFNRGVECTYATDYEDILSICDAQAIGWLAWEWGPGNEFADPSCDVMNMTTNSMYATLKDGWAKVVAETSPHGIKRTSRSSYFVLHGGACDPVTVPQENVEPLMVTVAPVPSFGSFMVTYTTSDVGSTTLTICTNVGSVVESVTRADDHDGTHTEWFSGLAPGVYYCRIATPTQQRTVKIIVLQ